MSKFKGDNKREHLRMKANYIVSYRFKKMSGDHDLSQTKNVSQGGMLITTNEEFAKGAILSMKIRFPITPQKLSVTGQVVESKTIVRDLIYETRIRFMDLDEIFFKKLGEFIKKQVK